jgi:hypothetical protein
MKYFRQTIDALFPFSNALTRVCAYIYAMQLERLTALALNVCQYMSNVIAALVNNKVIFVKLFAHFKHTHTITIKLVEG